MAKNSILFIFVFLLSTFLSSQKNAPKTETEIEINPAGLKDLAEEETSVGQFQWLKSAHKRASGWFSRASQNQDEVPEKEVEIQEEDHSEKMSRLTRLRAIRNRLIQRLHFLGTPEAATAVAVAYGVSTGISNFLWAFNWVEHAHASVEAAAIIQEIGGLSASAESFLMGALVPVILYMYNKRAKDLADEATVSSENLKPAVS